MKPEQTMTLRALIVDDEPLARRGLVIRLSGFDDVEILRECGNGREAVAAIAELKPDVIFLDILMPDMDGFEACRQLCADGDTKDIPVVFVTSKHQKADRVWAQMQGGKALVAKPFTADDIIDQINAI